MRIFKHALNNLCWLIPMGVGAAIMLHSLDTGRGNVFMLGVIFFAAGLTVNIAQALYGDLIDGTKITPEYQPRQVCCLCDGGPDNPHSRTCRCGAELWEK